MKFLVMYKSGKIVEVDSWSGSFDSALSHYRSVKQSLYKVFCFIHQDWMELDLDETS